MGRVSLLLVILFCTISKIYSQQKIGFEKIKLITLGFAGVSVATVVGFFVAANLLRQSSENGGDIGILFFPPFALITGTIAGLVYTTLPKSYNSKTHQIFIKQ